MRDFDGLNSESDKEFFILQVAFFFFFRKGIPILTRSTGFHFLFCLAGEVKYKRNLES